MPRRALHLVLAAFALHAAAAAAQANALRVCADPDNLPFSNQEKEGLENRIAEVVAKDLGMEVSYFWWPHQRGLVRHTLGEDKCDVLIGVPHDLDTVLTTKAYYRSTYVFVTRQDRHLAIKSFDDPALKKLRIGVHMDTPPWSALGERGLMDHVEGYPLMFDYRLSDPSRRPTKLLDDVRDGVIDLAIAWGPMAGWYAKKNGGQLALAPVQGGGRLPMTFDISMGVRRSDEALRARLEGVLQRHAADIKKILGDYGVPVVALTP
ncbi:MAG TPA: substrate-binding domain-containing protein [Anaeromyxobacteraceae bacterium]|nr:substrate-binding domain-containing protein [Anaeromyxobacteraceae bacterium]